MKRKHQDFICEICDRSFDTQHLLHKHFKVDHVREKKSIKCDFCHKKFLFSKDMKEHRRLIHGVKKIKCSFEGCERMFVQKSQMRLHINRFHLKLEYRKLRECDLCGWQTRLSKSVENHMKSKHLSKSPTSQSAQSKQKSRANQTKTKEFSIVLKKLEITKQFFVDFGLSQITL
jgi:hypothetical protein